MPGGIGGAGGRPGGAGGAGGRPGGAGGAFSSVMLFPPEQPKGSKVSTVEGHITVPHFSVKRALLGPWR